MARPYHEHRLRSLHTRHEFCIPANHRCKIFSVYKSEIHCRLKFPICGRMPYYHHLVRPHQKPQRRHNGKSTPFSTKSNREKFSIIIFQISKSQRSHYTFLLLSLLEISKLPSYPYTSLPTHLPCQALQTTNNPTPSNWTISQALLASSVVLYTLCTLFVPLYPTAPSNLTGFASLAAGILAHQPTTPSTLLS